MKNKEQVLSPMKEDILLRGLSQNTLESYTSHAHIRVVRWTYVPSCRFFLAELEQISDQWDF